MAFKPKRIQVKEHTRTQRENADYCGYSVTSTLLSIPDAGAVIVPWLVLQTDPSGVSKSFQWSEGQIIYDDWINVFMKTPGLQESTLGYLDELSQTWVYKLDTTSHLDEVIYRLKSFPTVVGATLRSNSLMQTTVDIPMVIVLKPSSACIGELVERLQSVEENKDNTLEKFYFEVDLGPALKVWVNSVLKEDFTVHAGRFAIGKGAAFNHIFDWQNVLCCVPCLPCCLVASPLYRAHRRLRYKQRITDFNEEIVLVGSESTHPNHQATALKYLMGWAKAVGATMSCARCGLPSRGPKHKRCTCKVIMIPFPPTRPQAPVDTKETDDMRRQRGRDDDAQYLPESGERTLESSRITYIQPNDKFNRKRDTSGDSDSGIRTPSDVRASLSSPISREGFSVGDLRIFSIACNRKRQPNAEAGPHMYKPRASGGQRASLF